MIRARNDFVMHFDGVGVERPAALARLREHAFKGRKMVGIYRQFC